MKKIFITGGHLTPALAVAEELDRRGWLIYYIGRKYALEGETTLSQEFQVIKNTQFQFLTITTGRLQRSLTRYTLLSLLKIPLGFIQATRYLLKYKPKLILSFGSYVAVPVVVMGWILGVPIITHEQTRVNGLANRIIQLFAKKICYSWHDLANHYPANKRVYTGLPLRKEIFKVKKILNINLHKPLLFISGGSLGSQTLNLYIQNYLTLLLNDFSIIHQTGDSQKYHNLQSFQIFKQKLPRELQDSYLPIAYINQDDYGFVMQNAKYMITRSGANTIFEIIAFKKPSLLIPLPWAGGNEQLLNARFLYSRNAAIILEQNKLNSTNLIIQLENLIKQETTIIDNLQKLQSYIIQDADKRIVEMIESCLQ